MHKEIFINESMGETRIAIQEDSQLVEKAVQNVLIKGFRTFDIKEGAEKITSTKQMGDIVIDELKILSGN